MTSILNLIFLLAFTFLSFQSPLMTPVAEACSAFSYQSPNEIFVGKSYDWVFNFDQGALYLNPRNIRRNALLTEKALKPLHWKSKLGSVTLTQFGIGLPISGMNEKGLVIEILQLNATEYNTRDESKWTLNESQWAQYQLDNYESIEEISSHLNDLRIIPGFLGIHYFITDQTGKSAVVEFLDGKPNLYQGDQLPFKALTNTPYLQAASYVKSRSIDPSRNSASDGPLESGLLRTSKHRFETLVSQISKPQEVKTEDDVFRILSSVRLNGFAYDAPFSPSQWNIVYHVTHRKISFRTRRVPLIRTVDFHEIDFNTLKKTLVYDMNETRHQETQITHFFQDYTNEFNTELLKQSSFLFSLKLAKSRLQLGIDHAKKSPSTAE